MCELVCFLMPHSIFFLLNLVNTNVFVFSYTGCQYRLKLKFCVFSLSQVDCLVLQLHRIGDQLEKMDMQRMDEMFYLLRDGFLLQEDLSSMGRLLLLEILEFRAGGWNLSDTAQKYYYSEVTD